MDINKLRKIIDGIDDEILRLLNGRVDIAREIGKMKSAGKKDIWVPQREKNILKRLLKKNRGNLKDKDLVEIFQNILNVSRSMQKNPGIAYLGPEATFTHLAAIKSFGKNCNFIPVKTISDVFCEVSKGRVDYGVVPVENSTEGVVSYTLDMFVESELKICSESLLKVSHNLLSRQKDCRKINRVYSHPQAIAQCRNWIEENLQNAKIVEVASTAEAASCAGKQPESAAIASTLAAQLYKLNIVAAGIEDNIQNYTRFLVIGKKYGKRSGDDKTSILFSLKDRVGALHGMLAPFSANRINLTKVESRPSKKKAWDYIFFVDFAGHVDDANVKKALKGLEKECVMLEVLGSYPRSEQI